MSAIGSRITGVSIIFEPFVLVQIKENVKAQRHWSLRGEFSQKGQQRRKCFNLMTSSWKMFDVVLLHATDLKREEWEITFTDDIH